MRITKGDSRILESLRSPVDREEQGILLSTGSTLLNLALTDDPHGGFLAGKYFFLVGDSASGKTFVSMTCLAEAARNPAFKDYRFIYDNAEDGMLMDVGKFFGREVARRLRPPSEDRENMPSFSATIEDFYFHLDDAVKSGKPFIYILDSMDALTSEADDAKFEEQKKAHRVGRSISGTYGMDKAKKNSVLLRKALRGLRETGSILIVVSQTRDSVSPVGWETRTRSGGRALRFYATCEVWSSVVGKIKRTVRGKPRTVGHHIELQVRKNRITGKTYTVRTAIYPSYGIDDVGSCVDYLVSETWWPRRGVNIRAKELGMSAPREKLIAVCEEKKGKLLEAVARCWRAVEEGSALQRKPRYQ